MAEALWHDVRHSVRALAVRPGFAFTAVATLMLCIGANVIVFTLVNALWLRPRPIADPDRVVMLLSAPGASGTYDSLYWARFGLEKVRALPVFELVGGQVPTTNEMAVNRLHVRLAGADREIETLAVTQEYFSIMGLPIRGRDFRPAEDRPGAPLTGILSYRLWRSAFAGSHEVIGTFIETSPARIQIIGIAPEGFQGARLGEQVDLWVSPYAVSHLSTSSLGQPDPNFLGLAKLRPGVSSTEAERAVNARGGMFAVAVMPVARLYGSPTGATIAVRGQSVVWLAAGIAAIVLFAGCGTLAAIVLMHYERRRSELAIRMALGCSRTRLVRILSIELGALALVGSVGAIAAAWAGLRVLPALSLPGGVELSRIDLAPDWRVALFGVATAFGALAVAAIAPVRRGTRVALNPDINVSSAKSTATSLRTRRSILTVHVAATIVVMVAAGLFVRTVLYAYSAGPGFDTARTVFATVMNHSVSDGGLTEAQRTERNARTVSRINDLFDNLRAIAGIQDVALGRPPITLGQARMVPPTLMVRTDGRQTNIRLSLLHVGSNYLDVLGVKRVAGRGLSIADSVAAGAPGERSVLVTRALAQSLWPSEAAIGKQLSSGTRYSYRVIGVVDDIALESMGFSHRAGIFYAEDVTERVKYYTTEFAIRTSREASTLVEPIRKAIAAGWPDSTPAEIITGSQIIETDLGRERLGAWFFSGFGLVTLVLGVGGVFGLVGYLATSRRREMGIRIALGAMPNQVSRLVLFAGLAPVLVGTVVGLVAAALLASVVDALLIGIGRFDPLTYLAATAVMLLATGAAGTIAAWRIRRLSPSEILRAE